jgi:mono/diheme cytochrome c family protein
VAPVPKRFLVFLAAALAALALAACGGGSEETTEAGTQTAGTTTTEETAPDASEGDPEAGAAVFETAGCGGCHTLAAAGSSGTVGPNLDELQPDQEQVEEQVTNGGGAMPAFGETLSEQQIRDVAAYVVESTSGAGADGGETTEESGSGGYG